MMKRIKGKRGGKKVAASQFTSTQPFLSPLDRDQSRVITTRLFYADAASMASSAGGIIDAVFPITDPSNSTDWANMVGTYKEFRVVAAKFSFRPQSKYQKFQAGPNPLYSWPLVSVVDLTDASVLTSYNDGLRYESHKIHSLDDSIELTWRLRMDDPGRNSWLPCVGYPTLYESFKFYSAGNTTGFTYGLCTMEYLCEFRGRA